MRRTRRWVLLGVLVATSVLGVSVPTPQVEADDRPPIVDLQPKNCTNSPVSIQHPLVCAANCPALPGCSLGLCARTDCGGMWCSYDCTW